MRIPATLASTVLLVLAAPLRSDAQPTPPAPGAPATTNDPAVQPPTTEKPVKPIIIEGFEVGLRTLEVSSMRQFDRHPIAYAMGPAGCRVALIFTVWDGTRRRLFRVLEDSRVTSVTDERGNNLLSGSREGGVMRSSGAYYNKRGQFNTTGAGRAPDSERDGSSSETFALDMTARRIPQQIAKISGKFVVEVVTEQKDAVVPINSTDKPTEIFTGVTARASQAPQENAGYSAPISLELTRTATAQGAEWSQPPIFQSLELLDDKQTVIGTLEPQNEVLVGDTFRAKFTNERGYTTGKTKPTAVRVHLVTQTKRIELPFDWGPIGVCD